MSDSQSSGHDGLRSVAKERKIDTDVLIGSFVYAKERHQIPIHALRSPAG
jgi:hypothetical protein